MLTYILQDGLFELYIQRHLNRDGSNKQDEIRFLKIRCVN